MVDQNALKQAQQENDVVTCQEILQDAYRTDVRPLIKAAREKSGAAVNPIKAYRDLQVRNTLIKERGTKNQATGL